MREKLFPTTRGMGLQNMFCSPAHENKKPPFCNFLSGLERVVSTKAFLPVTLLLRPVAPNQIFVARIFAFIVSISQSTFVHRIHPHVRPSPESVRRIIHTLPSFLAATKAPRTRTGGKGERMRIYLCHPPSVAFSSGIVGVKQARQAPDMFGQHTRPLHTPKQNSE